MGGFLTPIRAIIADDEPLLRAELADALAQWWPTLELVAQVGDGPSAVASAMRFEPDIVFLDVNMPGLDGLVAARQLRQLGYQGEVVFITAYDQHALEAFAYRASDYLVKPLEEDRLQETLARLKSRLATRTGPAALAARGSPWLKVLKGNRMELVALEDVACFKAVPGYTLVCTATAEHLIDEPLTKLMERLDPQQFVQVHRASVVNLRFVAGVQRDRPGRLRVELKHGLGSLEVARARAEALWNL